MTIAPQASITAATETHDNDSNCAMLMAVCLGFWMISATISAGVGIIMKLAGGLGRVGGVTVQAIPTYMTAMYTYPKSCW